LNERRRWLAQSPDDYALLRDEGRPAWNEFTTVASDWTGEVVASDPVEAGGQLEPDVVLLCRDGAGTYRVAGGVVVFPSHWALPDKMGLNLLEVHGVVPGLNTAIGPAIDRYLDKLKPGHAATRSNWGIAATAAWNLHPKTNPPPLAAGLRPEQMWLRVEHQFLTPLPQTGAMLFGIRIELPRLDQVLADEELRPRIHRALKTMPADVTRYKGLSDVLPALVALSGE
jgi:hypothetical protein